MPLHLFVFAMIKSLACKRQSLATWQRWHISVPECHCNDISPHAYARGGKRGGGRCHNSVKTGIFKNSVSSLSVTAMTYPLMPTLEQGGKRGGGQCHNSVKTGIFKNSVSSLSVTAMTLQRMRVTKWSFDARSGKESSTNTRQDQSILDSVSSEAAHQKE
jgi:hypothetical protein